MAQKGIAAIISIVLITVKSTRYGLEWIHLEIDFMD